MKTPKKWNHVFALCFSMDLPYSPEEFEADEELKMKVSSADIQEAILNQVNDLVGNNELRIVGTHNCRIGLPKAAHPS